MFPDGRKRVNRVDCREDRKEMTSTPVENGKIFHFS
jgi:hypothetical protein